MDRDHAGHRECLGEIGPAGLACDHLCTVRCLSQTPMEEREDSMFEDDHEDVGRHMEIGRSRNQFVIQIRSNRVGECSNLSIKLFLFVYLPH